MPRAASTSRSSRDTRPGAPGSWKITVPTWIALAPARMNWKASRPVRMPPMPKIGTSGSASCTCHTHRRASGRIAGPDRPPSVTSGESLAKTGTPDGAARRTAEITEAAALRSQAKT
jgi:hypothetical protein